MTLTKNYEKIFFSDRKNFKIGFSSCTYINIYTYKWIMSPHDEWLNSPKVGHFDLWLIYHYSSCIIFNQNIRKKSTMQRLCVAHIASKVTASIMNNKKGLTSNSQIHFSAQYLVFLIQNLPWGAIDLVDLTGKKVTLYTTSRGNYNFLSKVQVQDLGVDQLSFVAQVSWVSPTYKLCTVNYRV